MDPRDRKTTMQCEHAQEFLSEYVTGEMDRALAVTLENHLTACNACTEAVEGLRQLWRTLDQMPTVEPPPTFHAALMERISLEQAQEQRAARAPVRAPSWRRVFQPQVFAYAAVAVLLLVGAELVQVQRAALGPVGAIVSILHPAPLLSAQRVEWQPSGQGGGTMTVLLQAHSQVNGAIGRQHAHLQLQRKDGANIPGADTSFRDVDLNSDQPTLISFRLGFTPSAATDVLRVTLTSIDGSSDDRRTVDIPVAE
jgi:anti-sigma factor RsiW